MQRWEYKTVDFTKPREALDELNQVGADGWEAVAMTATWGVAEVRFVHPIVLLKRPLPDDDPSDRPV